MRYNYELGLERLKQLVSREEWQRDFNILAVQLLDNLNQQKRLGRTDQLNNRLYEIVEELDRITVEYQLEKTFTELSSEPPTRNLPGAMLANSMVQTPPTDRANEGHVTTTGASSSQGSVSTQGKEEPRVESNGSAGLLESEQIDQGQRPEMLGTGQRWGVLVGINSYEDRNTYGTLDYCAQDAASIQQQLLAGGFSEERMQLLTGAVDQPPLRENILAALQSVAKHTEEDDVLLFYFSGHGDAAAEDGYLIPKNGRGISLEDTAIPLKRVKEIMGAARARAKIIILDACHSGAKIRTKGAKPMPEQFFKQVVEHASGLAILSSCTQGQLSYEWPEKKCGAFTYYLLEALQGLADYENKGYVTVTDVNRHVNYHLKLWSSKRQVIQTPTLQYFVVGDIMLVNLGDGDRFKEPHLSSARDYVEAVEEIIKEASNVFSGSGKIYTFQCQELVQAFRKIEKPTVFDLAKIERLVQTLPQPLIVEMHYVDDEVGKVMSLIEEYGSEKKQEAKGRLKTLILHTLPHVERKLESAKTTINKLDKDKPPGSLEGGREGTAPQQVDILSKYRANAEAPSKGPFNQQLTHEPEEFGSKPGTVPESEDPLTRYNQVPLHAIFLYTTEDKAVGRYITDNNDALDTISGEFCDIHPIVGQLENKKGEDAYKYIRKLDVIQQASVDAYPQLSQLPGLFFWDHNGATEYVSFGRNADSSEISHVVRTVFEEIQEKAEIDSVRHAKQKLERERQMSSENSQDKTKKPNSWSDLFIILIAFLIIVGGVIALANFVSPLLLGIVLVAALLFFILMMIWLLRRSDDLSEGNFVKIMGRTFNALPLLRDSSSKPKETGKPRTVKKKNE